MDYNRLLLHIKKSGILDDRDHIPVWTVRKKEREHITKGITERGRLQNGKIAGPKGLGPPPAGQGKTFCTPSLLKGGNLLCPPITMAKASSSRVITT